MFLQQVFFSVFHSGHSWGDQYMKRLSSGFMCVLLYIDLRLCFRVLEVRTVCQENSALKAKRWAHLVTRDKRCARLNITLTSVSSQGLEGPPGKMGFPGQAVKPCFTFSFWLCFCCNCCLCNSLYVCHSLCRARSGSLGRRGQKDFRLVSLFLSIILHIFRTVFKKFNLCM